MEQSNKKHILTKSVNDYNQHGDYFIAWFNNYPTVEQLIKTLKWNSIEYCQWIYDNCGGRQGIEDIWYDIHEVEEGINFEEK
jgi:hypothetical protein